jgi:hypothetical protein
MNDAASAAFWRLNSANALSMSASEIGQAKAFAVAPAPLADSLDAVFTICQKLRR